MVLVLICKLIIPTQTVIGKNFTNSLAKRFRKISNGLHLQRMHSKLLVCNDLSVSGNKLLFRSFLDPFVNYVRKIKEQRKHLLPLAKLFVKLFESHIEGFRNQTFLQLTVLFWLIYLIVLLKLPNFPNPAQILDYFEFTGFFLRNMVANYNFRSYKIRTISL